MRLPGSTPRGPRGWELANSLHGLILQTCIPASKAYSWKHYACIPISERLGRGGEPAPQAAQGTWLAPSEEPSAWHRRRAPAAQQATKPGQEHEIPRALKDTRWPWMFSDNTDIKISPGNNSRAFEQLSRGSRDVAQPDAKRLACLSIPVLAEFVLWKTVLTEIWIR